ncbi:hypothetical protein [Enterococcus sp. AZ051]|uniref:hypothetical protein n=1 Tax=Enterococcus sp. AZ051 TaxID=2774698 RepID=UPI003D28EB57
MKAYKVGLKSDPDVGNEIVWAKNSKEAMKQAQTLDLADTKESYIDVEVKRYSVIDDMENLSHREFTKAQWRDGWWFHQSGCPFEDVSTDEEFYKWYDSIYAPSQQV